MEEDVLPAPRIEDLIRIVRGQRVMLDRDLARLYGVSTKVLNQAVKRNAGRFPPDFMFHVAREEVAYLKSQSVTSRWGGDRRAPPAAFTEQGVAMLSSVLRSERAIRINVAIMRAFVKLREALAAHRELAVKLADLERRIESHDGDIHALFDAIRELMQTPDPPRKEIGFHVREPSVRYRTARDRR
jgi:hypothetical protein